MKKWAFVSDFDGTISKEDFYWMIIYKYFPEGHELYRNWKKGELRDVEFLGIVFASIKQSEEQLIDFIHSIEIDEYVPAFIKTVQENGGDFIVLSAGANYYIDHLLEKYEVEQVDVYANESFFHNDHIRLNIDKSRWHYSERYGIDKSKVIQKLKENYETVYFIGDSEPDSHPAEYADKTFAKGKLQQLLDEREIPYKPVDTFKEVEECLIEQGMIAAPTKA